ncbi:MAG: HAD-IA family hydrolase [Phycisphaerales bacterium]|nr:HAD-IA family hydrolase [Phycisphaerales bacterium]
MIIRICRSWAEGCAAAGLDVRGDCSSPESIARRRVLSRAYETGRIGEAEFFDGMSETMGRLYTPDEVRAIHAAWLVGEYDGVGEIVDRLNQQAHLETALLSNTNASHWARQAADPAGKLRHFPVAGRLRHRYASHLMGFAKPDKAIYVAFAESVKRRPEEILFFDDLADNIETARACGWNAEQIDYTGDTAAQVRGHLAKWGVG